VGPTSLQSLMMTTFVFQPMDILLRQ
jgi:hypothetical protein